MGMDSLYNFSPTLWLLLFAALLAAVPLLWLWRSYRHGAGLQRYRALAVLLVFITFDLVVFGAFTRLTDSGLGCPDWPGCYDSFSPVHAMEHIEAAEAADPDGPVTVSKAWIEMIHRYIASLVGALTLVLAVWGWRRRAQLPYGMWLPVLTFVWVCLQGAFGAWTVTLKLMPLIVTLHLLGGMILLVLLQMQSTALRLQEGILSAHKLLPHWRWVLGAGLLLLFVQMALGAWVSTNYAVLACTSFPACLPAETGTPWWPNMDWGEGFALLRELGKNSSGGGISHGALIAIHMAHRLMAIVVFVFWGVVAFKLRRVYRKSALFIALLLLAQLLSGATNVILGWPLWAALGHTAGAAALVVVTVGLFVRSRAIVGAGMPNDGDNNVLEKTMHTQDIPQSNTSRRAA